MPDRAFEVIEQSLNHPSPAPNSAYGGRRRQENAGFFALLAKQNPYSNNHLTELPNLQSPRSTHCLEVGSHLFSRQFSQLLPW